MTHNVTTRPSGSPRHAVSLARRRNQELIACERGTIRFLNRPQLMVVARDGHGDR